MKKYFTLATGAGDIARKKIEKMLIAAGFRKLDDGLVYGEENNIYPVVKELDKENANYAICPISLNS